MKVSPFSGLWQLALFGLQHVLAVPYSEYILAPSSRRILPTVVHQVNGSVNNAIALISNSGSASFNGLSAVTYDFGKNIAGIISFNVTQVTGSSEFLGISFTESSLWISREGCDATADSGIDAALWFSITGSGSYIASKEHQRGGFRYLNVIHNTSGTVDVAGLAVDFTSMPHWAEDQLQSYTGYFHCEDDQLNRIWYAGAYTDQLCTIDPTAGDALVHLTDVNTTSNITTPLSWYNNYTVASESSISASRPMLPHIPTSSAVNVIASPYGTSVLVDGAKRDRLVWPGDLSIIVPSIFVSTNDMISVKNSLDSLLILQNSSGQLPYAGVPFSNLNTFSYTYHLYSLIGLSNYYLYSGDKDYLDTNWPRFKLGLNYSLSHIDSSGLMNVTTSADWLRFGMGGHNIEANAIMYYTISLGLTLASVVNDSTVVQPWKAAAAGIKTAANSLLWDPSAGLYRDNETTTLHPQDGNVWAVVSNLTTNSSQISSISSGLAARWTPYGAPAPEAGATVSPFISGFELQAHFLADQPQRALDLMKRQWGDFMLDDPRMTNSTFIEGYSTTGSLHYAPYTNDPRVSHAHGWATAPTSALTAYVAGLQILGTNGAAAGKLWQMSPNPGSLTAIQAGLTSPLGLFNVSLESTQGGRSLVYNFSTPTDTAGGVSIPHPACDGAVNILGLGSSGGSWNIRVNASQPAQNPRQTVANLPGGSYTVTFACD